MKRKSLSHVRLFPTPWTAAYQASPPMGFSRKEDWSGVPSPSYCLVVTIITRHHLSYEVLSKSNHHLKSELINFPPVLLECFMATHSSTLAWKIHWMEEPGRLQSMGSLGVGHDWVTSRSLFLFMHWRRKWQPTPVFLPGESQRRGSPVGCHLWGRTESDTTEVT